MRQALRLEEMQEELEKAVANSIFMFLAPGLWTDV